MPENEWKTGIPNSQQKHIICPFWPKKNKTIKKMHRLPQRKGFLTLCVPIQGVRKGEGESGVSSRLHGFEGAAEVGEGAHRLCGLDL